MPYPGRTMIWLALLTACGAPSGAAAAASGTPAGAAARLAALRGFRVTIEGRDHVAGRTFTATLAYRYPDRALLLNGTDEFIWLGGAGRRVVREDGRVRTSDEGAWLRRAAGALEPAFAAAAAIRGGDRPLEGAPDLAAEAGRLGVRLRLAASLEDGRLAMGLALGYGYEDAAETAPGFSVEVSERASTRWSDESGLPEQVLYRKGAAVLGEVRLSGFEALAAVPESLLEAPAADPGDEPSLSPLGDQVAGDAVPAVLRALRAAAAREPSLLEAGAPRVRGALDALYAGLFGVIGDGWVRDETRRMVAAHRARALDLAGKAGRERWGEVERVLGGEWRELARRSMRAALTGMIEIGEDALEARAEDEPARRKLLGLAGSAAANAYERDIVGAFVTGALAEVRRIADAAAADAEKGEAGR